MIEIAMTKDNLILKTLSGSKLYGTNNENSDDDYVGIFIPDKKYVYGISRCDQVILNEKEVEDPLDYTCYSLIKYIKLAIDNNPNILSVLYTPPDRIIQLTEYGQYLIQNRGLFLSKKSYHTYRGYTAAQKKKILTKEGIGVRAPLIAKYGYDVKFAMHLIRLLYECIDIFKYGEIIYPSENVKELIAIRSGEYSMDDVFAKSIELEEEIESLYNTSELKWCADKEEIEWLQMYLLEWFWKNKSK